MALNDAFTPIDSAGPLAHTLAELGSLVRALGDEDARVASEGMRKFVEAVPSLLDAPLFAAPGGMHDLPQILAVAWYARNPEVGFVPEYRRFLERMHWLLLTVQAQWIKGSDNSDLVAKQSVLDLITPARDARGGGEKHLQIPDRFRTRLHLTGRILMPTPVAVIAAIGVSDEPLVDKNEPFVQFVREVHEAFAAQEGGFAQEGGALYQAKFLMHMGAFLAEEAPRLATAVLPCDRTPVVAPWYAAVVLATRTYAIVLAIVLDVPNVNDSSGVPFALFALLTLADKDVEALINPGVEEHHRPLALCPMRSLFSARTKSMYTPAPTQSGPWWILLRATLSGLSIESADELARKLLEAYESVPQVVRNAAMLCVLMHTQTGMRIIGMRTPMMRESPKTRDLANFPIAQLICHEKDPSNGQTPLDVLMTTISGTSDLASLASDDLAFNASGLGRHEHAWKQELALRVDNTVAGRAPAVSGTSASEIDETVTNFCAAMRAIGADWIVSCTRSKLTDHDDGGVGTEVLGTLCRVAQSHATLHCGAWLSVSFALACELEGLYQVEDSKGVGEPALIRAPQSVKSVAITAHDLQKEEAWLRTHFCYLTEQALHSARVGGMWAAGSHLVLAAWVSTTPLASDGINLDADDEGMRIFARAITPHTVRDTENEVVDARLLSSEWRRSVAAHGWDSIVECAREFERALHARNVLACQQHARDVELEGGAPEEMWKIGVPQRVPALPTSGVDRLCAAAKATGPGRFDSVGVRSLDPATDVAMKRFRERVHGESVDRILICSTGFAHGASVAVLAVPANEADLDYQRNLHPSTRPLDPQALARAKLLRRVTRFNSV